RDPLRAPGSAASHQIEVCVVERTSHRVEEREHQIAIHEPVYTLRTGTLLERSQSISRAGEEAAPSAKPHRMHGGCGTIALRSSGEVEDDLGPFAGLQRQVPDEPVGYS